MSKSLRVSTVGHQYGSGPSLAVLMGLFFFSGVAGLIYEVVCLRLLRLVMGNTTFAVSAVLTTFMGGLASGAYLGGWIAKRHWHLLRVFGVLEGLIALCFLCVPLWIEAMEPLYRAAYQNLSGSLQGLTSVRLALSGIVLAIPTTAMGATLPVLSQYTVRDLTTVGSSVGRLYAANTLGAAFGVLAAGFVLIPSLGTRGTLWTGCSLSGAVAVASFYLARCSRLTAGDGPTVRPVSAAARSILAGSAAVQPGASNAESRTTALLVLGGYVAAGFASLVYEVAWTRVLSLLIGSSVYAFTLILAAFIFGLAAGAALISRRADRLRDPVASLALLQVAVAASAVAVVPLVDRLPMFVARGLFRLKDSFAVLQLFYFALILAILFVPTLLMGAVFPLVSRAYHRASRVVGRSVAAVSAAGTVGAIVGSFAAGFVLIPAVGTQRTIYLAALTNIAAALVLLIHSNRLGFPLRVAWAAGIVAAVGIVLPWIPMWDPARISRALFMHAARATVEDFESRDRLARRMFDREILFHREGVGATITVEKQNDELTLLVNGKPDASSSGDIPTQLLLAHVPMLLHPQPEKVLVIGLASGMTLSAAALYPVKQLHCAEIAPDMVRAARLFDAYNHHVLDDPRVRIHIADGRNHLALGSDAYDVIISEPSNPWMVGVADLFTQEFFAACHARLNPGGVACVWLEAYTVELEPFRSVVRTFQSVFPDTTIWSPEAGDFLLVGCKGSFHVPLERLSQRIKERQLAEDLARVPIDGPGQWLSYLVADKSAVRRFAGGGRLHSDDNALLEFSSPRNQFGHLEDALATDVQLRQHSPERIAFLTAPDTPAVKFEAFQSEVSAQAARRHLRQGQLKLMQNDRSQGVAQIRQAAGLNPRDSWFQKWYRSWLDDARPSAGGDPSSQSPCFVCLRMSTRSRPRRCTIWEDSCSRPGIAPRLLYICSAQVIWLRTRKTTHRRLRTWRWISGSDRPPCGSTCGPSNKEVGRLPS